MSQKLGSVQVAGSKIGRAYAISISKCAHLFRLVYLENAVDLV